MSLIQFFRILWARRLIILAATFSCVLGCVALTFILPQRWEAHTRVMLNLLKPDPLTGAVLGPAARTYAQTQIELIKDYSVAGKVVEEMDWSSDPVLIAQYQRRSNSDKRDFRRWAAQLVIDGSKAELIEGSNILQITYTATTPDSAKTVADALRKAYIDSSLNFRRDDATRNANWFAAQAEKSKERLDAAEAERSKFEHENGVILTDDKTDLESARLRALSTQASTGMAYAPSAAQGASASSVQLAELDGEIATESKTLGPNHPQIESLKARRAALAAIVAKEQAGLASASSGAAKTAALAGVGALERAVDAQKSRVLSQRPKIERLSQLQDEVAREREQYNKVSSRAAEFRLEAALGDVGITPLGSAVTPKSPSFPNWLLLLPGSIGLGMMLGVLVALLAELVGRRVRGVEELQGAIEAPVLAVVSGAVTRASRRPQRPARGVWPSGRREAVEL